MTRITKYERNQPEGSSGQHAEGGRVKDAGPHLPSEMSHVQQGQIHFCLYLQSLLSTVPVLAKERNQDVLWVLILGARSTTTAAISRAADTYSASDN